MYVPLILRVKFQRSDANSRGLLQRGEAAARGLLGPLDGVRIGGLGPSPTSRPGRVAWIDGGTMALALSTRSIDTLSQDIGQASERRGIEDVFEGAVHAQFLLEDGRQLK